MRKYEERGGRSARKTRTSTTAHSPISWYGRLLWHWDPKQKMGGTFSPFGWMFTECNLRDTGAPTSSHCKTKMALIWQSCNNKCNNSNNCRSPLRLSWAHNHACLTASMLRYTNKLVPYSAFRGHAVLTTHPQTELVEASMASAKSTCWVFLFGRRALIHQRFISASQASVLRGWPRSSLASRLAAGETLLRPTAMLYRNLVSMDVEESIRFAPVASPHHGECALGGPKS